MNELTDEKIIMHAQNAGFDDLAINYETEKLRAFARAILAADRRLQSARHAEELLAYEVTVSNLQARKEELIAHKSIEPEATAISELMLRTIRAVESFHGIKETP